MLFRIILYFHFRFAAPARQRSGNELCLRSANHKPCVSRARLSEWRIMLRFKIPASTFPLILAGVFAGSGPFPAKWPCITLGETSVQIAPSPWQAQLNVSFTSDPATATVRVQIVDGAEAADFAHVDDVGSTEANACEVTATAMPAIGSLCNRNASRRARPPPSWSAPVAGTAAWPPPPSESSFQ
jgi:hypothetical protein